MTTVRTADLTYKESNTIYGDHNLNHWQGAAIAAREQVLPKDAIAARYEYYFDPQGYTTPYFCNCE